MRIPTVTTIHDISFFIDPSWFGWKDRTLLRLSVPASIRRAAKVIAVSETSRREMIDILGVDPGKVVATPLGVPSFCREPSQSSNTGEESRSREKPQHPYALFVGGLQARKNWRMAIEAVALAREQWPELTLTITGRSRVPAKELESVIAQRGAGSWLDLCGGVSAEALRSLYQHAFAVIHPSLHEGFGLTPLEAFACGTPVIASDRGAIPEVAGDAAILLSPDDPRGWADAILSLRNDDHRQRLIAKGLERAKQFDWGATAAGTLDVYKAAVGKNIDN
jgi:glycosyltransferase involved in cell wall biosynthesis